MRHAGDGEAPLAPQPSLGDIARLVQESRQAGMNVALDMQVETPEAAPGALGRDACRIVREALTNASKHAPGAKVAVSLAGGPGQGLRVTVRNPLPDRPAREPSLPGTGTGLSGLAERVAVADGTLSYGADPAGDFVLNAALRWPA